MLTLDKKTVSEFEASWVKKLKVFFIEAGCSGTKIDMQTDFEITDDLIEIPHPNPLLTKERETSKAGGRGFKIYIPKTDRQYLENAKITRVVVADHTGNAKTRYIFASEDVEDRCGCGTSFAFEKPAPKIDLEKLKKLRENFRKWQT